MPPPLGAPLPAARTLALTLDVEADHGWARPYAFEALGRTGPLQALLDHHRAPLCTFATGEALERDSALWAWLVARGDEVGLHSWGHPRPGAPWDPADLDRALAAYHQRFGHAPRAWRPPYGRLHPDSLPDLSRAGLRLLSTYGARGGLRASPDGGPPLLDLPVSRPLGLPLTLAALRLLGPGLLRRAPARAVLCLHLHDVVPTAARSALPLPLRLAYRLGDRQGPALDLLDRLLSEQVAAGVRLVPLFSAAQP